MSKIRKIRTVTSIKKNDRNKKHSENFYFIDLFAGAGGLSKGLEAAGMKSILGIDNDKAFMETYKLNHKDSEVIVDDIRQVDIGKIRKAIKGRKVKLVCGGPPCQGFSTVGKNDPNDQRNHLFLEFVRVVREIKPDYILVENVTGLISKKNENTLTSIIRCFTELGYKINVKVLSAHHYGAPEKRRRTIILGNRFGVENIYPEQIFKDSQDDISDMPSPRTVGWAFENLVYTKNGQVFNHEESSAKIKNELERARIAHIPEGKGVRYEGDEKKYLPEKLWFGIDWKSISEGRFRQTKLCRLSLQQPSPTINTFISTYYHPTENRYLTPREAAAIQSFPADFLFYGTVSQQWKQIGNAVPPLLAKALGVAILTLDETKHLAKKEDKAEEIAEIRRKAFVYRKYKEKKEEEVEIKLNMNFD